MPEPFDTSPPVRLFTWRGIYVGLNGGYAWGSGDPTVISDGLKACTISTIDPSRFLGGGQIGYSAQFGNFALGAEASPNLDKPSLTMRSGVNYKF